MCMTTVDYQLQMPYMVCKDQCHIWYARTNAIYGMQGPMSMAVLQRRIIITMSRMSIIITIMY